MSGAVAKIGFAERVVASLSQGVVAAVIGAGLGAVTEPIVNKVLVERISVTAALANFNWSNAWKMFYQATLPTNIIKFPFYEVINLLLTQVKIPDTGRGAITGAVFTTLTLPLGNYRFCKSMGIPINYNSLYKAYLPTLARDIVYGIVRTNVFNMIAKSYPELNKTAGGRFLAMFSTAIAACILSAPGNELRGYYLQPPAKRQSFGDFFQPVKFVRSTSVGATNLGISLGVGTLVVGPAQVAVHASKEYLTSNPGASIAITLWFVHQYLARQRHAELTLLLSKDTEESK